MAGATTFVSKYGYTVASSKRCWAERGTRAGRASGGVKGASAFRDARSERLDVVGGGSSSAALLIIVNILKAPLPHQRVERNQSRGTSPDDGYSFRGCHFESVCDVCCPDVAVDVDHIVHTSTRKQRIDITVLLVLATGLFLFHLDRANLSSALTGGFAKDIGVSQDTINLGNQFMFMGTVILEIPANLLLQRFGPRRWMPAQVFAFGVIATLQIFVRDRAGYLVSRLCLGLAEAGYIPGALYTLSNWYTRRERAKRVSVFFFGMFGANAISPLLASGIMELHGARDLKGWQWLFLMEGILTLVFSALMLFTLPGSPFSPKPLLGLGCLRLTEEEAEVLQSRLRCGGPGLSFDTKIDMRAVSSAIFTYRRWPHFISTFAVFSTWSPLITYTPSIIKSLGFSRMEANALAAIGGFLALPIVFLFGFISDRQNRRGFTVIAAQTCYLVVLIVARQVEPGASKWSRFGLWTAVNAFAVGYHPVHNSWLQLNCHEAQERSISIAMWVMSAICGLMVGTQYFRADDAPHYPEGLRIMIIMVSVGIAMAVLQWSIYVVHNKRAGKVDRVGSGLLYTP
ncbi:inner membrane transport protein yfaV [Teratosphaeria destructans]|uniref:Inner membrane transport protein yfaV n=1 Tax=Teratosphaeria destructans TaxID=418781 RepID=A0A9W7W3N0_9PEZI|nr:inner membrane transport protein yfaV [Teratosphaeria destructans]